MAAAPSPAQLQAARYAELPGLASSPHAGLKAELALLIDEQMTPAALDAQLAAQASSATRSSPPYHALGEAIPAISRPMLQAQLDQVYAGGPLRLSPVQLERAREILRRAAEHRQRFQAALASADGGLGLRISDGVLADLRFLDAFALGCRLEALAAAEALAENEPEAALPPLATMLRAARLVGAEWNVTTRVSAANLRADALDVLQAIAAHDYATRETHERLLEILICETADWPADAQAWIGDRAAGLAAYELVRDGYYLSLLSPEEMQRLHEQQLVPATAKAVLRNLDGDELFYLQAMRRIIASCEQPYYERAAVLDDIRGELAALEQTGDYPLVAGGLLLADFETAHRREAEDLARCTAWKVALAAALGQPVPDAVANPLTGQPLSVTQSPLEVRIGQSVAAGESPPFVPLRLQPQQAGRPSQRR